VGLATNEAAQRTAGAPERQPLRVHLPTQEPPRQLRQLETGLVVTEPQVVGFRPPHVPVAAQPEPLIPPVHGGQVIDGSFDINLPALSAGSTRLLDQAS